MSGTEMADDIDKAINSGGYVIVPERAVDGSGRNAIYVYMTYNGQDGHQAWKISGGLNGGIFSGLSVTQQFFFGIAIGIALMLIGGFFLGPLGVLIGSILSGFFKTLIIIDNSVCAFKDKKSAQVLGISMMILGALGVIFGDTGGGFFAEVIESSVTVAVAGLDTGICDITRRN